MMTAEGLDWVLAGIEASLVKIHAAAGKRVRLQQAELDFLKKLETCRDFMEGVLKQKADTDAIKAIFGADGGGLGKARALLEAAELSAQNARDARLESCLRACSRLEAASRMPSTTGSKSPAPTAKTAAVKGVDAAREAAAVKGVTAGVTSEGSAREEAPVKETRREEKVEKEASEQEAAVAKAVPEKEKAAGELLRQAEEAVRQAEEKSSLQRRQDAFMQELKIASTELKRTPRTPRIEASTELPDRAERTPRIEVGAELHNGVAEAEEEGEEEGGEVKMTVVRKSKKVTLLDWYTSEAVAIPAIPQGGAYESKIRTLLELDEDSDEETAS